MTPMPTDIQVDEELVQALARTMWGMSGREPLYSDFIKYARAFLTEHRLVRLPEEPDGWQEEFTGPFDKVARWGKGYHAPFAETPTGRRRARYVFYGPPETVTSEEES